jgi:hypothetical protein
MQQCSNIHTRDPLIGTNTRVQSDVSNWEDINPCGMQHKYEYRQPRRSEKIQVHVNEHADTIIPGTLAS